MKFNIKRTICVGFAFFGICAFWQMYDFSIPLILKYTYGLGDTWSGVVMAMDNVVALFLLPLFGLLSDRCSMKLGRRMPFILIGTVCAAALLLFLPAVLRSGSLALFLFCLGLLLLAMAVYRSPAVALMPDVTPRPLRSKGNAVINLMGALGTVVSMLLVKVAVRSRQTETGETVSDYTLLFGAVALVMLVCLAVLLLTVRERTFASEADAVNQRLHEEKEKNASKDVKLNSAERKSMLFLLFSVFLWFMGYNAVNTAFSKYAVSQWGASESAAANCVMIGTVAAVLSYLPVGIVSSKAGRKKVILFGALLLAVCFALGAVVRQIGVLMYALFALIGIAWAAINVNSFPMVVEMGQGGENGRYTGYYYSFSMAAQVLTPILSGVLLENVGYYTLFPYGAVMVACSFVTMLFVRHGDVKPAAHKGLEAFDVGEDA